MAIPSFEDSLEPDLLIRIFSYLACNNLRSPGHLRVETVFLPNPFTKMRYEIFPFGKEWKWQFVDRDGEVLAYALQPLRYERCYLVVQTLRRTLDAPVVVLRSGSATDDDHAVAA